MPADEPQELTDERIYEDLKLYQAAGMIDYVRPAEPLGESWVIGWNGQILRFTTEEGIIGFLTGIQVCAAFVISQTSPSVLERFLAGGLR